ncbi:hypothetical protein ACFX5Q_13200 [Mesorhizobium sp. IMUNJ 23033]|uniref:hypothetical protein n=1 Tax=Mesorhizobium sp. IMUNJ 23033 TaxID=3378039 RepID=UPI003850EB55
MFAASSENIVRDDGQDDDNQGNQPAATAATRFGRRARRGEGVVWVRHKVSSEDEKYQSTPINAQPLNGFHTTLGKCRKQGNFNPESLVGMYFPRKFGRERAEANRFGLFR